MPLQELWWIEFQPSAVKIDSIDVTGDVAEAIGFLIDSPDLVVDSLCYRVAGTEAEVSKNTIEVSIEALGGFDDGRQLAVSRPEIPPLEKAASVASVGVAPEVSEVFLDGMSADRLEIKLAELVKSQFPLRGQIFRPVQPIPFGPG